MHPGNDDDDFTDEVAEPDEVPDDEPFQDDGTGEEVPTIDEECGV